MPKKSKPSFVAAEDPNAEREAQRYEHPIPSREFILQYLNACSTPRPLEKIAADLKLPEGRQTDALARRLGAMERDGQVIRNRRGDYGVVERMDLIRGRVIGHPDGFGFLVPDEGGTDVFLSARQMRSLLHGDRALVQITGLDRRGRREGSLVEVLDRANHQVVGRYFEEGGIGLVEPDNRRLHQDILVPQNAAGGATSGQIVVVEIVEQPEKRRRPLGRVVEVMGDHMAPGMEVDIAIRVHELPTVWPGAVEAEAAAIPAEVLERDKLDREDLRDLPLVTIDGEDARDFDDAVYCEPAGSGWRLLVAIADVAHYVRPGLVLDAEAEKRGNSVYFPDRVIPMLPESLSNGLCSLNPEVDRLCMVCELHLDRHGKPTRSRFFEGLMRSAARLTYTQVAAMLLEGDKVLRHRFQALVPHLENLHRLYQALRKRRDSRGAIDFETTETRIVYGADRKIERIEPVERNDAHKIIEECMVTANVAAAEFLLKQGIPSLYRIHEKPDPEKFNELRNFLAELGLRMPGGKVPAPKDYAKLLGQIQGREDAHLIQTVLLRSLRLAVYSPENLGHFGLAYDAYTHFTSPIRRYPDLLVHRAIKHLLTHGSPKGFEYSKDQVVFLGEHCSMTERRADEATRDAVNWLKCEYMLDKVGQEFDGVISAVTSFGIFVELKDIYVEGLVHVTALRNDYYHFDPVGHRLTGERGGRVYRLGNPVRVQVARVDLDERRIDFELAADDDSGKKRRRKGR